MKGATKFSRKLIILEFKDHRVNLWNKRRKLTLVKVSESKPYGLLGIICKANRSFEAVRSENFRAVNRNGYMVDLIKPLPKKIMPKEPMRIGGPGDLEAVEIRNLQW